MKKNQDETYEQFAERVRLHELGVALQSIAKGEEASVVMEKMARRIVDKMLHPIYNAIKESAETNFDIEKSRKEYEERYKHIGPRADHVLDDE